MAKSSRSSSKKENNRRKAATVFGPAELARDERLSAKLLDLAKQPKPEVSRDVAMESEYYVLLSASGVVEINTDGIDTEGAGRESDETQ